MFDLKLSDFYYIDPNDIRNVFEYLKKIGIDVKIEKNETEKYIDWIFYIEKIFEDKYFITNAKDKYYELRYDKNTKEWFHIQYKFKVFLSRDFFNNPFKLSNIKNSPTIWRKNLDPKNNTIISHYLCKGETQEFIETIYNKIDIYEFFLDDTCYNLREHFKTLFIKKLRKESGIKRNKKFICKFLNSDKRVYKDITSLIKKYL